MTIVAHLYTGSFWIAIPALWCVRPNGSSL